MEEEQKPVEQTEEPKPEKATKPKAAKPKRVKMRNTKPGNGLVGGIAQPWEKDVPAWEARGWVRA